MWPVSLVHLTQAVSVGYKIFFKLVQVWYCVSPKDRQRLEAMAAALFPELRQRCAAFLRHKDLLFSPRLLKAHNIDYVQARSADAAVRCMLASVTFPSTAAVCL